MQGEDSDACSDKCDNCILVERIPFSKDGNVQGHDWQKLTAFR